MHRAPDHLVDRSTACATVRTMSDLVSDALARRRFQMSWLPCLWRGRSAVGADRIYGVVAYNVAHRRTERVFGWLWEPSGKELDGVDVGGAVSNLFLLVSPVESCCPLLADGSEPTGVTATDPLTTTTVSPHPPPHFWRFPPPMRYRKMDPASIQLRRSPTHLDDGRNLDLADSRGGLPFEDQDLIDFAGEFGRRR